MLLNKERMLGKMEEFNLDVLIVSYPENVTYVSDFESQAPYMYRFLNLESFALFPRDPGISPCLILSKFDLSWPARFPTWVEEIFAFGNPHYSVYPDGVLSKSEKRFMEMLNNPARYAPTAGEAIVKALKEKGLDKGRIGLDGKNLSPATDQMIRSSLPRAQIMEAFELVRIIRMVKSTEELERLTAAGVRNERAMQAVLGHLAEGVKEDDLTQIFLEATAKEGAVFEFWNSAGGTDSSMHIMANGHFHPPSGHRLKRGDLFRYDGGSVFRRYHSDAGGCAVLGEPTRRQRECYRAIEAGMEKAMEMLRPGAIPSHIFAEATAVVERAGLKDYPKAANICGHGIGIEARDYPIFTRPMKAANPFLPGTYDVPVEEGMVISLEFPYGELGLGGFQIEYTLLVGKNGCEKLYPHDRELLAC